VKIGIRILSAADPAAEVRSLYDWLRCELDLRPSQVESVRPPVRDGEMGPGLDVVTVALGGSGAVTVLANSLSVWLRNRGTDIKFEISGTRKKILVDARRVRDPQQLIEKIIAAAGDRQ
jgi:Effector Associated Constant Component 1